MPDDTNAMNTENAGDPPQKKTGVKRWLYRASLIVAGLVAAAVVIFFVWGLADGSVSSFNIEIWLVGLVLAAIVLVAGVSLANRGHLLAAIIVLGVLAFPGIVFVLFILLFVLSGEKFI